MKVPRIQVKPNRHLDSLASTVHNLVDNGTQTLEPPLQRRLAVVTAIHTGPASVDVCIGPTAGLTATPPTSFAYLGVSYGSWYTPTVGDLVVMLQEGYDMFVLGKPAV